MEGIRQRGDIAHGSESGGACDVTGHPDPVRGEITSAIGLLGRSLNRMQVIGFILHLLDSMFLGWVVDRVEASPPFEMPKGHRKPYFFSTEVGPGYCGVMDF